MTRNDLTASVDIIWNQFGVPMWIDLVPTLLETMKTETATQCMARSFREGFKRGAMAVLITEKKLAAEQAGRN